MSVVQEQKKQLLHDIIHCRHGLYIETLFGEEVWNVFQKLLGGNPHSDIVVCGNGPVAATSRYGEEIDSASMVMRCNDYLSVYGNEAVRTCVGRKCDVHLICLQGVEFKKDGLEFLRRWCRETSCVLAMENSPARQPIMNAVQNAIADGDLFFSKIKSFREDMEWTLFPIQCARGFIGIAFALQAKLRLGLSRRVKCIGFGRSGHHGNTNHPLFHEHLAELKVLEELWEKGDNLRHLEWAEFSGELMKSVYSESGSSSSPWSENVCSAADRM